MRLRQHDAPISLTIQPSLNARVDGFLCCLSRNRISQLRLSQHCVVHEICFQHVAFVCLHMVGRSLGCGCPHARLLSPKRSSLCVDLLCVFICGNGHQLSLAPWSALTGLRRTTWFLRKGRSPLESLWGMPRRNASFTFFSDGDSGTPSISVYARPSAHLPRLPLAQ